MWKLVPFSKTRRNVGILGKLRRPPLLGTQGVEGKGLESRTMNVGNSVDIVRDHGGQRFPVCLGDNSDGAAERIRSRGQGIFRFHLPNSTCAPRGFTSRPRQQTAHADGLTWAVLPVCVCAQPRCLQSVIRSPGTVRVQSRGCFASSQSRRRQGGGCAAKGEKAAWGSGNNSCCDGPIVATPISHPGTPFGAARLPGAVPFAPGAAVPSPGSGAV